MDTVPVSVFINLLGFLVAFNAPFTFFRHPFMCGPHIFAGCLVVSMLSSFGMAAAAFHSLGAGATIGALALGRRDVFLLLGGCAAASAVGFALLLGGMAPKWRRSFFARRSVAQHTAVLWESCTLTGDKWGYTRNDARARTLYLYARRYWPERAEVLRWLHRHWPEWADPASRPPIWFHAKPVAVSRNT